MGVRDIIIKSKEKKSGLQRILDERQSELEQEYDASKMRRLIEEEKKGFRDARGEGTLERGKSISVMTHIMNNAQVDPVKAKQFLESLSQEDMNKLNYMMAAEGDKSAAFLNLARSKETNVKDLVSLIKIVNPSGGSDSKGIIEAVKLGIEVGKGNNPPASNLKDQFETVMKIVNPIRADLEKSRQDLLDEKLESIKAQQINPVEWYKQQKEIAADMGLTAKEAGTSALDLRLEEMRQSHDLDIQRMTWEQQKFLLQQEAESGKWDAIQETFAPIFQMASPQIRESIKNLGASVGKSLAPAGPETAQTPPGTAQTANFECPGCKAQLNVEIPPNAPPEIPVKCPSCGVVTPTTIQEAPQTQQTPQTPAPREEIPPRRSGRLKATYT